jgi:hypothetical protein
LCYDYTNVSVEVLGYELSSSIDTQRFIRLRILILAEPRLNKVTLNRRLRRERTIAAQATKFRHAGQRRPWIILFERLVSVLRNVHQDPRSEIDGMGRFSVTATGQETRKCHEAIAARDPHAVIPPRKNAKPWKPTSAGAIERNEAVIAQRYLMRTLWRRWSGYHRRSRVETKMHCMKLLGQSFMARDFERQVEEIQIRIAVLHRYTARGTPISEPIG